MTKEAATPEEVGEGAEPSEHVPEKPTQPESISDDTAKDPEITNAEAEALVSPDLHCDNTTQQTPEEDVQVTVETDLMDSEQFESDQNQDHTSTQDEEGTDAALYVQEGASDPSDDFSPSDSTASATEPGDSNVNEPVEGDVDSSNAIDETDADAHSEAEVDEPQSKASAIDETTEPTGAIIPPTHEEGDEITDAEVPATATEKPGEVEDSADTTGENAEQDHDIETEADANTLDEQNAPKNDAGDDASTSEPHAEPPVPEVADAPEQQHSGMFPVLLALHPLSFSLSSTQSIALRASFDSAMHVPNLAGWDTSNAAVIGHMHACHWSLSATCARANTQPLSLSCHHVGKVR